MTWFGADGGLRSARTIQFALPGSPSVTKSKNPGGRDAPSESKWLRQVSASAQGAAARTPAARKTGKSLFQLIEPNETAADPVKIPA